MPKETNSAPTRDRMVLAAVELFRQRGYDGTGFREVVDRAGAARGAIYHHFPGGKAELGMAVVRRAGGWIADEVERICADATPRAAVEALVSLAERLTTSGFAAPGCPIAAVGLAADDEEGLLRAAVDGVFSRWQAALSGCLARAGVDAEAADDEAALVVSAIEGAVVLCRVRGSAEPLDAVRRSLLRGPLLAE